MFPVPLVVSSNTISVAQFWEAILVYHNRPHLVNRKLAGHCQVLFYEIHFNPKTTIKISDIFTRCAILYEVRKLKTVCKNCIDVGFLQRLVECYDKNVILKETTIAEFESSTSGVYLSVRILLPRIKGCENCVEVVILDKNKNEAVFHGVSDNVMTIAPPFPYRLELSSGNMKIVLDDIEHADTGSAEWLSDKLFEKLMKWTCEERADLDGSVKSLSLIDIETYVLLYNELKRKYAQPLLKVWSEQAKTDPKKYVYEDIAIAAYLICLWSKYALKEEVRFVDLGCGNGLLVYFLNQEGYKGYGVDLRRRKTWDLYNGLADLREGAVTPDSLYSESNWLIGNHSDELTPWIPIMALKSSPETNFFVLPCCSFELNGKKFVRYDSSVSQYSNYLSYVQTICDLCQFTSHIDKLRIPSTKRTCIVGVQNATECRHDVLIKVDQFVKSKCSTGLEGPAFMLRTAMEPVRNCTQLGKSVIDSIINEIVNILLNTKDLKIKPDGTQWNKGGKVSLACLSEHMSSGSLVKLKKESGGLQTLLRNHRYIFELKCGFVSLRGPLLLDKDTKKYKDKPCWFLNNHPDGCLFNANICAYKHE